MNSILYIIVIGIVLMFVLALVKILLIVGIVNMAIMVLKFLLKKLCNI